MNQRLRGKDCDTKIVTQRLINQRLLRKGEAFYGVKSFVESYEVSCETSFVESYEVSYEISS